MIENEPGKDFGPGIDARDYIEALREMGETEGIAAFPPPGTDPPKTGVIVPDDYELPVGYERYYQYSDDGSHSTRSSCTPPTTSFSMSRETRSRSRRTVSSARGRAAGPPSRDARSRKTDRIRSSDRSDP